MQKSLYRGIQRYLSKQASAHKNLVVLLVSYSGLVDMEELRRFKASSKGYRTHVTRTLSKITTLTESSEPITPDQIVIYTENMAGSVSIEKDSTRRLR